jgi:hypothetical protein
MTSAAGLNVKLLLLARAAPESGRGENKQNHL